MYRYLIALMLLGIGTPVYATVEISEVAWMGSVTSPNHEWIELFNDSTQAVAVDGWTLADGSSLLITLAGTIPAGAYVLLEHTSDASAPGAAFLVYTGALVNTGATLTLRQSDGQIADQVVGGSDWGAIGGDNTTKATAQLVGGSWRTGTPTPGASNVGAVVSESESESESETDTEEPAPSTQATTSQVTTSRRTSGGGGETAPLRQATTELTLHLTMPSVAYARQPVVMAVTPRGIGRTIQQSLTYQWNFGDFTVATGSSVTHRFEHPGTYLVTVRGYYGRHDVAVRQALTVLPVTLSVTRTDDALFLNNDAVYDIDVSGFRVMVGKESMTLPANSFVAAKQSVRLPMMSSAPLVVRDGRGAVVLREERATRALAHELVPPSTPLPVAAAFVTTGSITTPPVTAPAPARTVPATTTATATSEVLSSVSRSEHSGEMNPPPTMPLSRWPYALLCALLVGAVAAVLWPRSTVSLSE